MIWKALFGNSRKKENVDSLKVKILKFQSLLNGNNHVLELIADAEESLGGDFLFDMQYLRWLSEQLESAVGGIVSDLNYITGNQYRPLSDAFLKVRLNVENALLSKSGFPDAPLVIPLSDIGIEMSDVVGEKMARLGEIKHHLNCPVPDGFVVTGQACRIFFDQNDIRDSICSVADALKKNSCTVKDAEDRLTRTILRAEIPKKIIRPIKKSVSLLEKQSQGQLRLAVRSSAMGEDGRLSFAGLHETILGVKSENAIESYKKVAASLFTSRAINYRLLHGQSIESATMAVGFMTMIPSRSGGVLYTLDPLAPEKNHAIVSASPGLGKMVVEGEGHLDRFEISRSAPYSVLSKNIAVKENKYDVSLKGGTDRILLSPGKRSEPSVSDQFLTALTQVSLKIEKYMRSAQDIEWAENDQGEPVILQTRPLRIQSDTTAFTPKLREEIKNHNILISGSGMVACRGIAYGRVVVIPDGETIVSIPPNAVIVARYSSPILAELVATASAVITDFGSPTSHLATITREMKIPSIMDVENATRILKDGMEVTVDAEENIIYEGKIDALIQYEAMKNPSLEDIAEFHILSRMLKYISPLYLKNPQHARFQPRYCTTYHDIIRLAHEKAVLYFFDGHYLSSAKHSPYCKILNLDIPIDLKVIDIGGGFAKNSGIVDTCKIEDIRCDPLRFLLEGLTAPGAWSTDAAGMDFESFMSSLTRTSAMNQSVFSGPQPNLAIISNNYLNLNFHLGYHFSQADSYVSDSRNDNYIYFRFAGGVTDYVRRSRRAEMIAIILRKHDFMVETKKDFLVARLKKFDRALILKRLWMIGYLIGFTRQMDVRMRDDSMIEKGVDAFMRSIDINSNTNPTEVAVEKNIDVLVLDDETIVCNRLKEFLEQKDMSVETFTDSEQAINRLKEKTFDVVVTDMKMPGPTGMDVLRFAKNVQPSTQVIIISAYSVMDKLREAEAMGTYHYLTKPFQLSALHALIKKAAKHAKTKRAQDNDQAH